MMFFFNLKYIKKACCAFSTSTIKFVRFPKSSLDIYGIGQLTKVLNDHEYYKPGQLFIHKAFAYRGIIVCGFNPKVYTKPASNEAVGSEVSTPFYQVLIHKDDWLYMNFPYDMTSYLTQSSTPEEKNMNVIHGMDCVPHKEIIPYCLNDDQVNTPIEHDLFERFFKPLTAKEGGLSFKLRKNFNLVDMKNQGFWLNPQSVYKQTTNDIEVQIMTFYLGASAFEEQLLHYWRYTLRVQNLNKQKHYTMRSRDLKVLSLNKLSHFSGPRPQARLTHELPTFQYSSHVNLLHPKGGYMWGKILMEKENGEKFDAYIPTIPLEVIPNVESIKVGDGF